MLVGLLVTLVAGFVATGIFMADAINRRIEFDLFALSSDTKQLPIAMVEAMACGIPVVATRLGDVAHIVPAVAQSGVA